MVVELSDVDLPVDFVLRSVLNSNWQVSSVVETAEFTGSDASLGDGASLWLLDLFLGLSLSEASAFASSSASLFEHYRKEIQAMEVTFLFNLSAVSNRDC